jgi:2-amino-4-hydroxy-6-hydroxymethyldihydropteridine diphosphokinase
MHKVLIAIGSNHRQSVHVQWASQWLSNLLDKCRLSRCLWTPDIKGTGRWYMNRLAVGESNLSVTELEQRLKETEVRLGRTKQQVTIDLDLMLYDDEQYHLSDWPRPYIQQLLQDIVKEIGSMTVINSQ